MIGKYAFLSTPMRRAGAMIGMISLCAGTQACGEQNQRLPRFDFTRDEEVRDWQPTHDIARIERTSEGMVIVISGSDPYAHGPARDYPPGLPLWMRIRLKSDIGGMFQVFYFSATRGTSEENSVRFNVRGGGWEEVKVPMPPLGPGTRLRLDPPGSRGQCIVASIAFEPRILLKEPAWPRPQPPRLDRNALSLVSGDLRLLHARNTFGGFTVSVVGQPMAAGNTRPLIGYTLNGRVRWLDVQPNAKVTAAKRGDTLTVKALASDPDGAAWTITQRFSPAFRPGAIDIQTTVSVNRDRRVVFLPMIMVLPGVGSFGATKNQAIFAGLEYLDKDEPSSSEADIIGPGSKRQVPDILRITFPLMAIQQNDRYIGLIWDKDPAFSALFDSPDRLFQSGGHVMGVLFPHSDGQNRVEGNLLPYDGETLAAAGSLSLRATLIGGRGPSAVPAVQHYVALRGLPPVPDPGMDKPGYARFAAGGWLDSKIRQDGLYRHAYWPGFTGFAPGPAADAAYFMEWLARQTKEAALAERLRAAAQEALEKVSPSAYNGSGVSHVRYPVAPLLYGHVEENTNSALGGARGALGRFEPDGSIHYRPQPGGTDFGKTHFAPDANGLTGAVVAGLLEQGTVCGDPEIIQEGLRVLRALNKFDNTVPRGAQTWEIPLHTPDILASAHLVKAYTLGYELTGDRALLDRAIYWAWTGVPFVYLVNPTKNPVGLYATTPVLGATHWKAPNWMGLPVQWCGLVYSDALYRLHRHVPDGPWKQIADGITVSGIQQSFDATDPDLQGLLPDSFNFRSQTRNPVAINPGTVQANAIQYYNGPALYDYRVFRSAGLIAHAPGTITDAQERSDNVAFRVQDWIGRPYYVLIVGLKGAPKVRINGQEAPLAEPHRYLANEGRLILRVEGSPKVEVSLEKALGVRR